MTNKILELLNPIKNRLKFKFSKNMKKYLYSIKYISYLTVNLINLKVLEKLANSKIIY